MLPKRLLVSQCFIYLIPTLVAAVSLCNNPEPAASGKNISVKISISRPESRSRETVCTIPFLHGQHTMVIPPQEALQMKLGAPRRCLLGLCENGACKPTGKYELCESIASYDQM
ncbi:hypothetical protein MRX96_042781 [Rhipicephalus microplus]